MSHLYRLTSDGNKIVDKLRISYPGQYSTITKIVKKLKSFCGLNPYVLSCAAKVYYILQQGKKPISEKDAAREGRNLKWEITEDQAECGIELLLALNLVEKTKT